ncbi:MAG TPA: preprotein translocase subunit SecA [Candidatus Saccharimonadales bacterium]|nr:preprotein translocase subunit SecA [Candidatus Saccharimonadales bacterium]
MSIFRKPLNKVLGDPVRREIKRYEGVVGLINDLEADMSALSDEELKDKTREFRERLGVEGTDISHGQPFAAGLTEESEEEAFARAEEEQRDIERARALDDLLPEAFAVVREASKRTLGMRHFDVQLIGGIVLHQGRIAEMKTGEGKTLVATLALYLNALEGRGAHLVTVNDYLARRDAGWNAALYDFLGMSVGVIAGQDLSFVYDPTYTDDTHPDARLQHLRPCSRREAYATEITYSTNNELGFDYLRDNMAQKLDRCVQRRLHYAIVDEVDSILVDEARTPLIISGQASDPTDKFYTYARLIPRLVAEDDYTIDEKTKSATLTEEGVEKIEKWTGLSNVYDMEHVAEAHQINQALRAHALWHRDKDYIVRDGEVIIVDEFTGRTMPGRRWSDGLHQAIEAKEGVSVQQETVTLATITFQNFFRIYDKLAGMTGTALTEAEEFHKIYKLEVVPIPTHRDMIRLDEPDLIYKTEDGKYRAVVDEISERYKKGQPTLVGTTSIERSERISRMLDKLGVQHSVLNAKLHEKEADVIANAGQAGSVTIATNMAGRGTDIVLGAGVPDLGGLYIIGTERHESRRIDNQLRGRAGRQGDPGESRFFLSFEDDLMRVFGGERMQGIMGRLGVDEDTPIESKMVSKQIEGAQARVEGSNFDSRRHVVEYDDVMNKQREIIYGERRKILEGTDTRANFIGMVEHVVQSEVPTYCEGRHREAWDFDGLWERMHQLAAGLPPLSEVSTESLGNSVEEVSETLSGELIGLYEEKEQEYGAELLREVEQSVMLQVIDTRWLAYLTQMDHLREGMGFQAYGQMDPLVEYKAAAFTAFQDLTEDIQREIVRALLNVQIRRVDPATAGGLGSDGGPADPAGALEAGANGAAANGAAGNGAANGAATPAPTAGAAEATAPASPRADRPGGATDGAHVPPARPAAALASGALARATGTRVSAPLTSKPIVRNIVESSGAGTQRAGSTPAGAANGDLAPASGPGSGKVGRNQACPCGSGKKYKFCHGK